MKTKKRTVPAKVYLVGAGPGDPSLLTLRAAELLQACDVVLYDRLVHPEVLKYTRKATLIPVGKKPAHAQGTRRQDFISRLMIRYSYAGFNLVRLKGGDPFVFGRGGEEMLALAAAQVPFELVPGVSSFYAAPEAAGIPVTHRGIASGFGVFTAHAASDGSDIDWATAARLPTAVFLMGVRNLSQIVENLIEQGRAPQTPVAIISRATFSDQRVLSGTLANIEEMRKDTIALSAPAVVIVGEVVNLRNGQATVEQQQWDDEELEFTLRGEVLIGQGGLRRG